MFHTDADLTLTERLDKAQAMAEALVEFLGNTVGERGTHLDELIGQAYEKAETAAIATQLARQGANTHTLVGTWYDQNGESQGSAVVELMSTGMDGEDIRDYLTSVGHEFNTITVADESAVIMKSDGTSVVYTCCPDV